MLLLVGLGNPGPGYARNRHNIGFTAVDAIARRYSLAPYRRRFHGLIAEGEVPASRSRTEGRAERKVLALKPTTYVNDSGLAVAAAARFHKIPPSGIIVVHDDLDLAPGKVRVKRGGGHGGHNGLRSIDAHLGRNYRRLRLGIGHPEDREQAAGYVLHDFAKADKEWLGKLLNAVAESFPLLVEGDDAAFMSKVALAMNPPAPRAAAEEEGG
ncbi:MAG: aminoacyl-tRNA hydrolase [Alphaproteobacteria bacterium]